MTAPTCWWVESPENNGPCDGLLEAFQPWGMTLVIACQAHKNQVPIERDKS
jgi:hypothetical protein